MSAFIDLTGQVFGRITVRSRTKNNKHGQTMWACRCSCGVTKDFCMLNLRSGDAKSCGCLRKELSTIDMKGQHFGRWTVLSREGNKWLCQCDCGNRKAVSRAHLLHNSKSCGCLNKDNLASGNNRRTHGMTGTAQHLMWLGARKRAKAGGLPCNIELSDIIIPDVCPALGIPLHKSITGYPEPNSPSLDKLKPELGYVKGNIRVISHKANTMKQDATLGELKALTAWLEKEQNNGTRN